MFWQMLAYAIALVCLIRLAYLASKYRKQLDKSNVKHLDVANPYPQIIKTNLPAPPDNTKWFIKKELRNPLDIGRPGNKNTLRDDEGKEICFQLSLITAGKEYFATLRGMPVVANDLSTEIYKAAVECKEMYFKELRIKSDWEGLYDD